MKNIGPHASPTTVYTAAKGDIFAVTLDPSAGANLTVNGNGIPDHGVWYLAAGDEIKYQGPAASLAVVRLGDEVV